VARGLLERETLDGEEVGRLVDTAYGGPVHDAGATSVPHVAPSEPAPGAAPAEGNGGFVAPAPAAEPTGSAAGKPAD